MEMINDRAARYATRSQSLIRDLHLNKRKVLYRFGPLDSAEELRCAEWH